MLKRWWGVLALASLVFAGSIAGHADGDDWAGARSSYDAGKYEDALHELLSHPAESASYYYNIGTIYSRMDRPGMALAYLEKANRLQPHDPDVQHNLEVERAALGRLIGPEHLDPASNSLEAIADHISLDEVRGTLGLLGFVLALLWIRAYLKTRDIMKTLLRPAGLFGLFGFALTAGVYGAQRLAEAHPPAYCLQRQVVRSGPGDSFLELAQLESGTKIRLLGPSAVEAAQSGQETWRQVRYSQDGIGWIRASSLLLL